MITLSKEEGAKKNCSSEGMCSISDGMVLACAAALPVICSQIPFGVGAEKAGLAIGFALSSLLLVMTGVVSLVVGSIYLAACGLSSGLLNTGSLLSGSLFYQFVGFCILGYGAEATPFGKRFSYYILKLAGRKPKLIVITFFLTSAVLSSILSNTAVMIMMAGITAQVLKQMDQRPGNSAFGATCMLASTLGPCIGGQGFIQGCGGTNFMAIESMAAVTAGGFRISALQWAVGGWMSLLFILPLVSFIICKWLKFDETGISIPDRTYYVEHLQELGPIRGKELRWLIYTAALVVLLIAGAETTTLLLVLVLLCVAPGIGCFSAEEAFHKAVPWEIVLGGTGMCVMGTMFSNSGLTTAFSNMLAPAIQEVSPLVIMIMLAYGIAMISMYFIATTYPCITVGITMVAPVIESMGLNPAIVLFPTMIALQYMFGMFAQPIIQHNYRYGYWGKGQITALGTTVMLCCVMINCLVAYYVLPEVWGMPLYLS